MAKLYILCLCLTDHEEIRSHFLPKASSICCFVPMCAYSSYNFFSHSVQPLYCTSVCVAIFLGLLTLLFFLSPCCNSCGWISSFNNAARRPVGLALRGALVSIRAADSGAEPSGPLTASLHNKRTRARKASWSVR